MKKIKILLFTSILLLASTQVFSKTCSCEITYGDDRGVRYTWTVADNERCADGSTSGLAEKEELSHSNFWGWYSASSTTVDVQEAIRNC